MDLTCEPDHDRRKEALVDLVFLDLESLAGMEDLATRQDPGTPGLWLLADWRDPGILGLGLPEVFLRNVAARKVWPENRHRVGARKAWLWNRRHEEAQMGWWSCRYPSRHGSAQTEKPSEGS